MQKGIDVVLKELTEVETAWRAELFAILGVRFWHFQKVEVSDLPILAVELRYLRKTLLFLLTSSSEGPFCVDVFVSILWYVCQPLIPLLCRAGVNTHTNKQAPDKVYTQSHCPSRM